MKDKVEKILSSREWTFADLTNMSQLVKDFSEEIYTQLDAKEKLTIVWEKDVYRNVKSSNIQSFGSFFQTLVTEEIQLQVASILQEQLINANVNFSNNKNKEDEKDDISKGSLGGKPLKERTADEKKDSEE
jgi:hypothetical protein|tara:strand:+ start:26160 stop:26552 length:393 start_codon:yes stop_codon:yes gene_type:complete